MMGPATTEYSSWDIFCGLLRSLPARFGSDPVLDLTAEHAIDSYQAYKSAHGERELAVANKSAIRALNALRSVLLKPSSDICHAIPFSMMILIAAEVQLPETCQKTY